MPENKTIVCTALCPDYDENRLDDALRDLLAPLGGMGAFVSPGMTVLLKPNLIHGTPPERGATTHPAVLRSVAKSVVSCGGKPVVGESPGYQSFAAAARRSGLMDVIEELGLEWDPFVDTEDVHLGRGHLVPSLSMATAANRADLIINLPKLKSHGLTLYTGCIKNMFGVISGAAKAGCHMRFQDVETFSRLLAEVYGAARPGLNILDAIVGMDGNGPRNGQPAPMGVLLAGTDGVAVDAIACRSIGLAPEASLPVAAAAALHYGVNDLHAIDVVGPGVGNIERYAFNIPHKTSNSLRRLLTSGRLGRRIRSIATPRPLVAQSGCRACNICVKACPAHAISLQSGTAEIDNSACIRCYCCQELCEHGAIELSSPAFTRLFGTKL